MVLDPNDKRYIEFDWDTRAGLADGVAIASASWSITAIVQSSTALTNDSTALSGAARKAYTRLLATTASDGDQYYVENKITTDETPAQEIEQGFRVLIQHKR